MFVFVLNAKPAFMHALVVHIFGACGVVPGVVPGLVTGLVPGLVTGLNVTALSVFALLYSTPIYLIYTNRVLIYIYISYADTFSKTN